MPLFNVKNGNGVVDGPETHAQATLLVFKNAAAKNKVMDTLAELYVRDVNDINAPSLNTQQKYQAVLTAMIRETYRRQRIVKQEKAAADAAQAEVDVDFE